MIAYHGTVAGGLSMLTPFASPQASLKYPCVYLSTNEALASIYIWNKPYKWMSFGIESDGTPAYTESFHNSLYVFYGGVRGYIYSCEGSFETDSNTNITHAVISKQPVPIRDTDVVEDAYERILRYEREGALKIYRYECLTDDQWAKNRNMVLGAISRLELLKGEHPLSGFVASTFPELWHEASTGAR